MRSRRSAEPISPGSPPVGGLWSRRARRCANARPSSPGTPLLSAAASAIVHAAALGVLAASVRPRAPSTPPPARPLLLTRIDERELAADEDFARHMRPMEPPLPPPRAEAVALAPTAPAPAPPRPRRDERRAPAGRRDPASARAPVDAPAPAQVDAPQSEAPAPAPESEAPEPAPPAGDLSALTLARAGRDGWNLPLGDGRAYSGLVVPGRAFGGQAPGAPRLPGDALGGRAPGGGGASRSPAASASPRTPGPDRSAAPAQPRGMDERLQALYPREARDEGLAGEVTLILRVEADGSVRVIGVRAASAPSFVEPCRRVVLGGGAWTPARDAEGRAESRVIPFTCRFELDY